jgi:hypothetical protein
MRRRSLRVVSLWILTTLLAACGGSLHPTASPTPSSRCPSSGYTIKSLAPPQPSDVLLELTWEGGFTRPELAFAFGRVPAFTLLPDGSVYYVAPLEGDRAQVMAARLAPAETDAMVQVVLDLGFERLESYTDECQRQADDTCMCVQDSG